jgi:hypothetical protein
MKVEFAPLHGIQNTWALEAEIEVFYTEIYVQAKTMKPNSMPINKKYVD